MKASNVRFTSSSRHVDALGGVICRDRREGVDRGAAGIGEEDALARAFASGAADAWFELGGTRYADHVADERRTGTDVRVRLCGIDAEDRPAQLFASTATDAHVSVDRDVHLGRPVQRLPPPRRGCSRRGPFIPRAFRTRAGSIHTHRDEFSAKVPSLVHAVDQLARRTPLLWDLRPGMRWTSLATTRRGAPNGWILAGRYRWAEETAKSSAIPNESSKRSSRAPSAVDPTASSRPRPRSIAVHRRRISRSVGLSTHRRRSTCTWSFPRRAA